jgi:hypothetical protein
VRGRLPATPYDDPRDAPSFVDLGELLADDRVDAVALDASLAQHLPALRRAGLLVLLPEPTVLSPELLREAREVPDAPEVAVGLLRRWEPWSRVVTAAVPLAGAARQLTARGWPRGEREAAELVDLVAGWCGEVLSASAGPAVPVAALPDGCRVAWSLLTASGATVLVSHDGPLLVRLTLERARLDAGPDRVWWDGGADLPLPAGEPGLVATARALLSGVGGGDVPTGAWPWPADLGDLVRTARVLAALRQSGLTGAPVRVS